jgi:hypothetical protein
MASSEKLSQISISKEICGLLCLLESVCKVFDVLSDPSVQKDKLVASAMYFSTLTRPLIALIKQEVLTWIITRAPWCAPHWRGQG